MISDVEMTGSIDTATLNRIHCLLTTPVGSVPFDRNFGVDLSALDNIPAALEGAIMVEYSRKMLEYFPEYTISNISFAVDCNTITPTVVITSG